MYRSPWWHVAILTVSAVGIALLVTGDHAPWRTALGSGAIAALVAGWFLFGRHGFTNPRITVVFSAYLTVVVAVATAAHPSLATLMAVAMPLLWVLARGIRDAVAWNVVIALLIAVGTGVSLGGTVDAFLQGAFTASLSLAFSLAIGFWISGIESRSEERQRLLDELTAAQGELAALERESGIRSERERIARELHDTIAQSLTAIVMQTQGAVGDLDAGRLDSLRDRLALIEEGSRDALGETRTLVASGASVVVEGGLVPALHRLAERFQRESGVEVSVRVGALAQLPREVEVVLLRCAQESIANARKHAHASRVELAVDTRGPHVVLTVSDNGVGFDVSAPSSGFGIAGMRERVGLAGGVLEVASDSAGTRVTVSVPVEVTV